MEGTTTKQLDVNIGVISASVRVPAGWPFSADPENVRISYPVGPSGGETWRYTNASELVHDLEHLKAANVALGTALHAAGQELGEARRNLQDDQEDSANIIRRMKGEIDDLKTRNENQTAMIHAYWTRQAATEHDYQKLVDKLADAEQRIANMQADIAECARDEAEGDQILGDRVEFEDVDTYSELATEAVRLADEVQDLKARQPKGIVWLMVPA